MLKRLVIPLTLVAVLVVAAPANAKHKPTQRARIHALEKKVNRLERDLDKAIEALEVTQDNIYPYMDGTDARLDCLFAIPIDAQNYTPPDAATGTVPFAVFNWSESPTPTLWMTVMHPSCVVPNPRSARIAGHEAYSFAAPKR